MTAQSVTNGFAESKAVLWVRREDCKTIRLAKQQIVFRVIRKVGNTENLIR